MLCRTIQTYSIAQKQFCWSGIGARSGAAADRGMAAHRHSFFQIFFVGSGSATHEIAGRVYEAGPGSIFFVSPFTVHRVAFPACYVVYFSAEFLHQGFVTSEVATQEEQLRWMPELAPFVFQPLCSYVLAADEILEARYRCKRIESACASKDLFDASVARAELTLLLTLVGKKYIAEFRKHDEVKHVEAGMDKRTRAVLDFMKANFSRSLMLADVAEQVHLTGSHLTHLLKRETGKSFKQLLDELRLGNSKNLLAYTDAPMNRIAHDSGFLDQAHFARRFRSQTQLTPGQFRRQHRLLMHN